MISRWVVGVALLFGILLLMLPDRDEQSIARIGSASMLVCTKELREQVAKQVLAKETVAVTFSNSCPELIASLKVDDRGTMVIVGNRHPVTMRLYPQVENGKIRWRCHGEPAELITGLCKP
ncbi:MAG: hypothetical protein OQK94_01650 [Gammaproteobacteria bacterium]|nr:hypothetical protein [Gammaproteobacteria bacterium]MCW8841340.1 hypothetical protein [Gammaproteobacteria bacterium]MCW8957466.1 hypothetical protein [Gammaproteobacteria bacterium]MCW8972824.1 hypothetical protein [Gammaproteobacteria bacterium]MCW8992103.1 hypothetical protein [Gammaproteobacteria bacterium]